MRQKYKNKNFIQQIIIFSYLKILKNEKRIDFEKINKYIRKYIAVFERFFKKKNYSCAYKTNNFCKNCLKISF